MKHLPIILISILLTSCGLRSKMETHDKAQIINLEPKEEENKMIIDPSKQLLAK